MAGVSSHGFPVPRTRVFLSKPFLLPPPPTETNLSASPQNECGGHHPGARILLTQLLCLLCTQRQPKLAHVFQRLPPPAPLQGPTGNSAKIIISNWDFVQSSAKTSSPFRIIRLCSLRLGWEIFFKQAIHVCVSHMPLIKVYKTFWSSQ